ncbi:hypothetical protein [Stomatobaculum longum]|uniref:hypothetical protein n=1 Tax=Stomatobaculum longum TaxID=796942 RepID=UPI003C754C04
MDGNTDISVRCEIENQTETEVPELELQIRLPEGIGAQKVQYTEAFVTRGQGAGAVTEAQALTADGRFDWRSSAVKPGEHYVLQAKGVRQAAEDGKHYAGMLEVTATLQCGTEQHITRRRYQLSGMEEKRQTVVSSALLETESDTAVNQQVALRNAAPAVGQLSLLPGKAKGRKSVPGRGIPVMEILVCSMALWALKVLLRQLLIYREEGKRKFNPEWKPFEERKAEKEGKEAAEDKKSEQ